MTAFLTTTPSIRHAHSIYKMAAYTNLCCLLVFLLFSLLSRPSFSYILLDKQTKSVRGGDIQHYTISYSQILILYLISDEGDADMYVSRSSVTETPNPDDYEYSSASTGRDVIAVPHYGESSLSLGIHGHIRYDQSKYRLFLLVPSKKDYEEYQIWETDPETGKPALVIGMDTLWMANQPRLHRSLDKLANSSFAYDGLDDDVDEGKSSQFFTALKDWVLWIAMILLKIIVEVLA